MHKGIGTVLRLVINKVCSFFLENKTHEQKTLTQFEGGVTVVCDLSINKNEIGDHDWYADQSMRVISVSNQALSIITLLRHKKISRDLITRWSLSVCVCCLCKWNSNNRIYTTYLLCYTMYHNCQRINNV